MRRLALLAASLLLHTAAMAPWQHVAAAWICLVPLLLALDGLSPRRAFLTGLLWGTAQIWLVCYWTAPALAFYWEQPWWFGVAFLLVASAIFVGIYYGLFALALVRLRRRFDGLPLALLTAALWVSIELGQARLLGGDPWMLLGYALVPQPLWIQIADVGGVYLLSFVVALINALVFLSVRRAQMGALLLAVAVLGAVGIYGWWRLGMRFPHQEPRRIAVVQGNNDPGAQWQSAAHGRGVDTYLRLTREALQSRPDLIVWPESAVTFFFALETLHRDPILRMVDAAGVELILGAPHADTTQAERPRYFNSAFHVDAGGAITARYDKVHLLPFAEYFPLQTIALLRRRFERVRSFTPGGEPQLLPSPLGPLAVAICFEGIFPELVRSHMARGAGLLLNLSNDSWLGAGAGPEQHLAMVALRAVEHRSWVIRATTTGVSAIVDPHGRVVQRSDTSTEAVLTQDVAAMHIDTLYEHLGESFAYACLLAVAIALLRIYAANLNLPSRPVRIELNCAPRYTARASSSPHARRYSCDRLRPMPPSIGCQPRRLA